jgi:hypothetical protein
MIKYKTCSNSLELYYLFKEEFLQKVEKELAEWTNKKLIVQYFMDMDFEKLRVFLDDRTDTWKSKALESIEEGVSDIVYNQAYRSWKRIDDMFMGFYEQYNELLELNVN